MSMIEELRQRRLELGLSQGQVAAMMGTTHRASMLQDLEAGRPLELDAQFDAVRDLARLAGVPTPVLDILVPLLRMRARQ